MCKTLKLCVLTAALAAVLAGLAAAADVTAKLHTESVALAQKQADEKRIREWEKRRGDDCGAQK